MRAYNQAPIALLPTIDHEKIGKLPRSTARHWTVPKQSDDTAGHASGHASGHVSGHVSGHISPNLSVRTKPLSMYNMFVSCGLVAGEGS